MSPAAGSGERAGKGRQQCLNDGAVPLGYCSRVLCSKRAHPFAVVLLPGHAVMLPGPSAPRRAAQRRQRGRQRARGDEEER